MLFNFNFNLDLILIQIIKMNYLRFNNLKKVMIFALIVKTVIECEDKKGNILKENFNYNEACVNANNCYIKTRKSFSNHLLNCQCEGTHSNQCGSEYCTVTKESCEALMAARNLNDVAIFSLFKSCNNGNKAFKMGPFNFKLRF